MRRAIYNNLPWFLKPLALAGYEKFRRHKFSKLKADCNGMLSAHVYEQLFYHARNTGPGSIVEIGAAHGAGTIAMALGLKDAGSTNRVVAIEKGEGGSRSKYGSKNENIEILRNNIREWGVSDRIDVVPKHLERGAELPGSIADNLPVSLLCIDADGYLDRDFELLYDHLLPGAIVVIDDYSPQKDYQPQTGRYPLGGGKQYRTFCYANLLIDEGYLTRYRLIDDTLFAVKPYTDPTFDLDTTQVEEHLKNTRTAYDVESLSH